MPSDFKYNFCFVVEESFELGNTTKSRCLGVRVEAQAIGKEVWISKRPTSDRQCSDWQRTLSDDEALTDSSSIISHEDRIVPNTPPGLFFPLSMLSIMCVPYIHFNKEHFSYDLFTRKLQGEPLYFFEQMRVLHKVRIYRNKRNFFMIFFLLELTRKQTAHANKLDHLIDWLHCEWPYARVSSIEWKLRPNTTAYTVPQENIVQ